MARTCSNCGTPLTDNQTFCTKCGTRNDPAQAQPQGGYQQAQPQGGYQQAQPQGGYQQPQQPQYPPQGGYAPQGAPQGGYAPQYSDPGQQNLQPVVPVGQNSYQPQGGQYAQAPVYTTGTPRVAARQVSAGAGAAAGVKGKLSAKQMLIGGIALGMVVVIVFLSIIIGAVSGGYKSPAKKFMKSFCKEDYDSMQEASYSSLLKQFDGASDFRKNVSEEYDDIVETASKENNGNYKMTYTITRYLPLTTSQTQTVVSSANSYSYSGYSLSGVKKIVGADVIIKLRGDQYSSDYQLSMWIGKTSDGWKVLFVNDYGCANYQYLISMFD